MEEKNFECSLEHIRISWKKLNLYGFISKMDRKSLYSGLRKNESSKGWFDFIPTNCLDILSKLGGVVKIMQHDAWLLVA